MAKRAEKRFVRLANHHKLWHHKYRDVAYCQNCGAIIPKTEKLPDYYISLVGDYVECKNNDSTGTWKCAEIMERGERYLQRDSLTEYGGWLFIELADGRAPKKAGAWLIRWENWLNDIEPILIKEDMKSIRRETTLNKDGSIRRIGADRLFKGWELQWVTNYGWTIPNNHKFLDYYKAKLIVLLAEIDNLQQEGTAWQEKLI